MPQDGAPRLRRQACRSKCPGVLVLRRERFLVAPDRGKIMAERNISFAAHMTNPARLSARMSKSFETILILRTV